jgi:hypothetical protein
MISQNAAMLIVILIIMTLINTINVIAQSQNETNETGIGMNQSVSGRISGLGGAFDFGPKIVNKPPE